MTQTTPTQFKRLAASILSPLDRRLMGKLLLTLSLLFWAGCGKTDDSDAWTSLFNGTDLQGWHIESLPEDKGKDYWSVADGVIRCDTQGRSDHNYIWLISDNEYADFELSLKVRTYADAPGNSGVQVRSRYDTSEGWMDGPQVDINPPGPYRNGFIYDETRGGRHWIAPNKPEGIPLKETDVSENWTWEHANEGDGWNQLRIVCRGATIQTFVNGILRADLKGAGILDDAIHQKRGVGMKGHIALQLHQDHAIRMDFKDISIQRK